MTSSISGVYYHLICVLYLAEWSFKVDLLRFLSVFCAYMVFIFFGLLGLIDGLLARFVRTAEAGRESAFAFHEGADLVFKVPFFLIVAYLALPFPLYPQVVIVFLAATFFAFTWITSSHLKKYL